MPFLGSLAFSLLVAAGAACEQTMPPEVEAIGPGATGIRNDVRDPASLDDLYDVVKRRFGRVDVLFANAGVISLAPLGKVTEAAFDGQL